MRTLALLLVGTFVLAGDLRGADVVKLDVRETPAGNVNALVVDTVTPSPDGRRLAYAARAGDKLVLTADGKPASKPYDGFAVGGIVFSPSSARVGALVSTAGDKWLLVVDSAEGKPFDTFAKDSLQFSPDSRHVAVVAARGPKRLAVVDGAEGALYDDVKAFAFAPAAAGDGGQARGDHPATGDRKAAGDDKSPVEPEDGVRDKVPSKGEAENVDENKATATDTDNNNNDNPKPQPDDNVEGAAGRGDKSDPRGARYAYAARQEARWRVVTESGAGEWFDEVGDGAIAYAPDGSRIAYAARRFDRWFVVDGGKPGAEYDEIAAGSIRFSPDGAVLAYAARKGAAWTVVVGGKESAATYVLVAPETLAFAPGGKSVALAARAANGWTVVEGDAPGPSFEDLAFPPAYGPGAQRPTYVGVRGGRHVVVHAGKEGSPQDEVMEAPAVSADGRVAYAARLGNRQFVVLDGKEGPNFDAVGRLAFSPDGKRLAYGAQRGNAAVVRVDDLETPTFTGFLPRSRLVFEADGGALHAQTFRGEQLFQTRIELVGAKADKPAP